jgi:D-alanyl-D-alanine carboxypeptidase/D-alanyl-D-alanine-endopeptidase (penicillin-binding protein 4)
MLRKFSIVSAVALLGAWQALNAACPLSLKGGNAVSVGICIAPIDGSKPATLEWDSERLMTPASTLKSLTTASALASLGANYRWTTTVATVGELTADGELNGNVVVQGGGDPTLGSIRFSDVQPNFISSVTSALREVGVTSVAGRVIQGAEWPGQGAVPSWEVEDVPLDYGAGFYALNYADNAFTLTVRSMDSKPYVPNLTVLDRTSASGGSLDVMRGADSSTITLTGSLGKRSAASLRCSMPNPPEVLLYALNQAAGTSDHKRYFCTASDSTVILSYTSPTLADVCRSLMVRSDNQMAEGTLRALAPRQSRAAAIKAERALWSARGVDLSTATIRDGSGLSRANAISPRQLCDVLRYMAGNSAYVGAFARAGQDGTVRSFLKDNKRSSEFVLKSGSMSGVLCYAGYHLDPETGVPTHALVVMVNNLQGASADVRQAIQNLLLSVQF